LNVHRHVVDCFGKTLAGLYRLSIAAGCDPQAFDVSWKFMQ